MEIQNQLNEFCDADLDVDGYFGKLTKSALIKALQMHLNKSGAYLVVDGIWGPKTKKACRYVHHGSNGTLVNIRQAALYGKCYDPNGLDGSFGNGWEAAVVKYQSNDGLEADGVAGRETFGTLLS